MARCEVCGNNYDKSFTVNLGGREHTFDSFECRNDPNGPNGPNDPNGLNHTNVPNPSNDPNDYRGNNLSKFPPKMSAASSALTPAPVTIVFCVS